MCLFFFPSAVELAMIMDRLYGGVCYAGIDTDPELKYPKGAGRVAFSNQQSYIAAISARFVQLQHGEIDKRVSRKKRVSSVFISLLFRPPSLFNCLPTPHLLLCFSPMTLRIYLFFNLTFSTIEGQLDEHTCFIALVCQRLQ